MAQEQAKRPRRRAGRIALIAVLAVLVIVVGAVLVAPSVINWNSFSPQVAAAVRDATGKDLRIDGDISVRLLPRVAVSVDGIQVLDPADDGGAALLSVAEVSATARLWPLLARRLIVDELVISEPVLTLVVDADGRQNWAIPAASADATTASVDAESGGGLRDILLADMRIAGGRVTYEDMRTGRSFAADDITVAAALPEPGNAATMAGELRLNDEPATVTVSGEASGGVLAGERLGVEALIETRLLRAHYAGNLQNQPAPAADGAVEIDTTSLAALADWLGAPLPQFSEDPGPLMLRARFAADDTAVDLQELVIQGDGVDAVVNGRLDRTTAAPAIEVDVQSTLVDVDHYLTLAQADRPADAAAGDAAGGAPDLLALIPDTPLDLSPLKAADAAIQVNLGGVRAAGFDVGPINMAVNLVSGVATTEISEIGLYGGAVRGRVVLDGSSGTSVAVETDLAFDGVAVDQMAAVALAEAPIAGVAGGALAVTAEGASPRSLVASAVGELTLALRDPVVTVAPGTVGDIELAADLPGPGQSPRITAQVIYNGEPATVALSLDPLDQILAGEAFAVAASLDSRVAEAMFDGRVGLAPALTVDGAVGADVASVAELAAWLDLTLEGLVEEPGGVSLTSQFAFDGAMAVASLSDLSFDSGFADLRGSGSFDGGGAVPRVTLDLASDGIALEKLLAPPDPDAAPPPEAADPAETADAAPIALPDTPLDLGGLQAVDADIRLRVDQLSTPDIAAGPIDVAVALEAGRATATIAELGLGGGTLSGSGMLDGGAAVPALSGSFAIAGLAVDGFLADPPVAGVASGALDIAAEGESVKALVANLVGKADFSLDDVEVRDERVGSVDGVSLSLNLPGADAPTRLGVGVTYNAEPIDLALTLDPLGQITAGDPLTVVAAVTSRLVNARYDGVLQLTPALGVEGALDINIASVADFGKWLGQPLEQLPADPGPLAVTARFAADAAAVTFDLDEFAVAAEGLDARATGRVDASGEVPNITLDIEGGVIDLDRFLPPPAEDAPAAPEPADGDDVSALPADNGWSDAPLNLAGLRRFEGQAHIEVEAVSFRDLGLRDSVADVALRGAILDGDIATQVAEGEMSGAVTVDASGDAAALSYRAAANGIQARPVLRSLGATDRLSGTTTVATEGTATGRSQRELFENLDGTGEFRFVDGAIHGINLAAVLRQARTLGPGAASGEAQKTDFAELAGSFDITDGIVANSDLMMLAPLVRLNGAGVVAMPPQTLDYDLEAKLVASLEGQGGDAALAGLPIPVSITGPWAEPSYGVDWENVFQAVAQDPARLVNLPDDLREIGSGLGVALPVPDAGGLGAVGGVVEGLLGGGDGGTAAEADEPATPLGGAVSVLEQLIAPQEEAAPEAADEPAAAPAEPEPVRILRGLFGN